MVDGESWRSCAYAECCDLAGKEAGEGLGGCQLEPKLMQHRARLSIEWSQDTYLYTLE